MRFTFFFFFFLLVLLLLFLLVILLLIFLLGLLLLLLVMDLIIDEAVQRDHRSNHSGNVDGVHVVVVLGRERSDHLIRHQIREVVEYFLEG